MQMFMMQWPSAAESLGFAHTASRKRFTRPSSSPSPVPFANFAMSSAPGFTGPARYLASSFSVFGHVLAEVLPAHVREARAHEAHQIVERGKPLAAPARGALVVLRRKPHGELAHMRVAQRVAAQDLRIVLEDHDGPRAPRGTFQRHGFS